MVCYFYYYYYYFGLAHGTFANKVRGFVPIMCMNGGKREPPIREENAFTHTTMGYVGLSYAIPTKLPPVAELE